MKLTLYIDGKEAALSAGSDEALILWTYTRDDADAPAAVKNSFTKTVTLPACDANDRIFSHAGTLDRVTAAGMFDALRRTPFIIYADDGRIIERGYLKLDRISRRGEVVLSYDVTLYGGLGGFFYDLTYNADGSKRTLADMRWVTTSEQPTTANLVDLRDQATGPATPELKEGWDSLLDGSYIRKANTGILNYVPANNGIPDGDFDAGKAYYRPASSASGNAGNLAGIVMSKTEDGVTYGPHPDAGGGVLLDLGGKFTEWEVQCFVPYQQREAWNMARFLMSIQVASAAGDYGGWRFILDDQDPFFDEQGGNPYFWQTWVTLEPSEDAIRVGQMVADHLTGTRSPADYLLGFAKMFGLVFIVDETEQTVTLTSRNQYYAAGYSQGVIDLSDRADTHGEPAPVRPCLMTARTYRFTAPTDGAFASGYASRYGRTYGDFLVDTGFDFDADGVDVMRSVPFRGAADVRESSPWFFTIPGDGTATPMDNAVKFPTYNDVTYALYSAGGATSIKVDAVRYGKSRYTYGGNGYAFPAALPQFHDSDNRRLKAPDVMLFFTGALTLPAGNSASPVRWHIGIYGVDAVTGGRAVWNISPSQGVTQVTQVPLFQRSIVAGQDRAFLDYGEPKERADGITPQQGDIFVYPAFWQRYMEDRFDRDTMVLTVRVDLSGLPVGPGLLRRFFYYRGSLWSLNKVTDYNPARPGLTQCEFVRVKDVTNYTAGQTVITA